MICFARRISAKDAAEIGMISSVADNSWDMIHSAVEEVKQLGGKIPKIPEGKISIPDIQLPITRWQANLLSARLSVLVKIIMMWRQQSSDRGA
jgi:enoyl-CoA hydratase/carnithine racemase